MRSGAERVSGHDVQSKEWGIKDGGWGQECSGGKGGERQK